MSSTAAERLSVSGNPLRTLLSPGPWTAVGYLASYVLAGSLLFAVATTAVVVGTVAGLFTFGLPMLIGTAWVVRGCAQVERGRAVLAADEPIPYNYREIEETSLFSHIRARCADPAFLRDVAYLVLLFPFLFVLDALALGLWLLALAGISLPLWYSAPADGVKVGHLWVDTLPEALAVSAASVVLFLVASQLVVPAARLHLAVATAVLRPPRDPLAEAKAMLADPGPLHPSS